MWIKKSRLIISYQFSESEEEDSLNYWPDIKKIRIISLSNIAEKQLIVK